MTAAEKIRDFLLEHISEHPQDIVTFSAMHFSGNRMTIYRQLKKLLQSGVVIQIGAKKGARYYLQSAQDKKLTFDITEKLDEFSIWKTYFDDQFSALPKNVYDICNYGVTEILNNARDHSQGKNAVITTHWDNAFVEIRVGDDGIGIFKKLQETFGFEDIREGPLNLSKGKFTTDPKNHTGEGIFFSSRAFDQFAIIANGLWYYRDNVQQDWFVERKNDRHEKGTFIHMQIHFASKKNLIDLFKQFQEPNSLTFDRTNFLVELSKFNEERFISRSQAKRITLGLEKFSHVILDFKNVETVGQGFVDEIFRVFVSKYPNIKITYINANDDVKFMVERGIATANKNPLS